MSDTPPESELLRPREVAEILGVRPATIARWARAGRLTSLLTPGGHRRYTRSSVTGLLKSESEETRRLAEDAVRLYEQGWSIRQVAARFDLTYGAMRRLLLRHTHLRDRGGMRDK